MRPRAMTYEDTISFLYFCKPPIAAMIQWDTRAMMNTLFMLNIKILRAISALEAFMPAIWDIMNIAYVTVKRKKGIFTSLRELLNNTTKPVPTVMIIEIIKPMFVMSSSNSPEENESPSTLVGV